MFALIVGNSLSLSLFEGLCYEHPHLHLIKPGEVLLGDLHYVDLPPSNPAPYRLGSVPVQQSLVSQAKPQGPGPSGLRGPSANAVPKS